MNRRKLQDSLTALGVRPDAYSLNGGYPNESYVLSYDGRRWSVYYSERGQASGVKEFETESEACAYILQLIKSDSSTRTS